MLAASQPWKQRKKVELHVRDCRRNLAREHGTRSMRQTLGRMTDAIGHRGPDDSQIWIDTDHHDAYGNHLGVALGFRRLSIIDLEGARQPMANEDGSVRMVFNGEIYNYKTLRRRLEGTGHRFATHGDGESILHLYEDIGTDCFSHLNGMFAIAIWDTHRNRLVLARDRIGQKPLYYAVKDDRLVFGSELKCVGRGRWRLQRDRSRCDRRILDVSVHPTPGNHLEGCSQSCRRGILRFSKTANFRFERYWDFDPSKETPIDAATRSRTTARIADRFGPTANAK